MKALLPINPNVYIVESNGTTSNADKALKTTGMSKVCESYGAPFINLSKVKEKMEVSGGTVLKKVKLAKLVLESFVISAAKMKTRKEAGVTLSLKNMFGLLPKRLKLKYHFKDLDRVIVEVNTIVKPSLSVIDGFIALEGPGPVEGRPVNLGIVAAGRDAVATDVVAASIMGFNPLDIRHIRMAAERGLGTVENIEVVGCRVEDVARKFSTH